MRVLVLSGGGAFGAYQAGAWRALHERDWRPDLIVGASIGAVNGYVISRGASIEEIFYFWRELPAHVEAEAGPLVRWPIWGHAALFRRWVKAIHGRTSVRQPVSSLQITITELPSCALRVVEGSQITLKHLLASCALPGVLPPARLDGRLYADGGLFCRLPLRQALAAGDAEIIAVDAMAVHPSPVVRRLWTWAGRLRDFLRKEQMYPAEEELSCRRLLRVERSEALGSLAQCLRWERGHVEHLLEAGYRDARNALANWPDTGLASAAPGIEESPLVSSSRPAETI